MMAGPIVGSWPGPSFKTNDFVREYAGALEAAGCRVVDVASPIGLRHTVDVLHIHWPEQLLWQGGSPVRQAIRIVRALRAIAGLRRRGTRIVWMVHNLKPHESTGVRGLLWRAIARLLPGLVDGVMTLSPATLPLVTAAFPALRGKPAVAVRHPPFLGQPQTRGAARRALNLPPDVQLLAMLGFLRPYKGADALLRSFRSLPGDHRRLIIAGRCASDYAADLRAIAGDDRRITIVAEAISDADLLRYTAAADWIVLPFKDYLHSSSIVHALSFGRPVLTPHAAFAEELATVVPDGAIRMYDGALTPETLRDLPVPPPAADLGGISSVSIGREARRFYESLGGR